ncbi:MAG: hypothetical protein K2Q32_02760 [Alphaproteobacteria bacterium]|nr:hypothetical protein [Alphaproteobacteria bacterium]
MLAVLNHRASAYDELHTARTKLMSLKQTRGGLFIKKRSNPFNCHSILALLSDIAAAKFQELRLLISLDMYEQQLRIETRAAKQHRIWLGKASRTQDTNFQQPQKQPRQKMDNLTAFLLTTLWLRRLPKPAP